MNKLFYTQQFLFVPTGQIGWHSNEFECNGRAPGLTCNNVLLWWNLRPQSSELTLSFSVEQQSQHTSWLERTDLANLSRWLLSINFHLLYFIKQHYSPPKKKKKPNL